MAERNSSDVAPSRGRGLKPPLVLIDARGGRRPLTGAWIETRPAHQKPRSRNRRPLTGAWIEPSIRRSTILCPRVAPSRGRGLKICLDGGEEFERLRPLTGAGCETPACPDRRSGLASPPHGGVD